MGIISDRLLKAMQITASGVKLPIIITLTQTPDQNKLRELQSLGLNITFTGKVLPTVSGNALPINIRALSLLPYVSTVNYDEPIGAFQNFKFGGEEVIPLTDSSAYINADKLNAMGINGNGITVAVIDTGSNKTHPMLETAISKQIQIAPGDIQDGHGHGTWCASAVAGRQVYYDGKYGSYNLKGIAPEASIIAIKVLDDSGSGQTSFILQGIEAAVENKADVISLSLGSMFDNGGMDDSSKYIDTITNQYGIFCAIAAGNSFANFTIGSPGGARGAITVGSVNMKISPPFASTFSSKGPTSDARIKPNISAPGGDITPTYVKQGILAATSGSIAKESGERYASLAGTSMATPHVAGVLALLLQAGLKRDRELLEQILSKTAMNSHLKNPFDGWGVIDALKAYQNIGMQKDSNFSFFDHLANTQSLPFLVLPKPAQAQANSMIRLPYIM